MTDSNCPHPDDARNETPRPARRDNVAMPDWGEMGVSASALTSAAAGPTLQDTTPIRIVEQPDYTKPDRPKRTIIRVRIAHDPSE